MVATSDIYIFPPFEILREQESASFFEVLIQEGSEERPSLPRVDRKHLFPDRPPSLPYAS